MPYPLPLTRTEAYLAYKAGVIQQSDLKPSLAVPRNGIDAWLAYWTGLTTNYPVKNVGKNLFDKTMQITDGYTYASDGTLAVVQTCSVQEAYIQVKPNSTYTLHTEATSSQTTNFRVYICEYTASKTFIKRDIPNPVTSNTNTITTTANTHFVRLCFSTIGIDTLQFEAGSNATAYESYTGEPLILQEEEAYIAYLCGVINEYPEKCLRRVGAYLRYLISARWGRPDHPLNREELYLSLIKTQFIPSGDPSSDIVIDGTAKAPFVDVKMYGDTYQQTYSGKNLFPSSVTWEQNRAYPTSNQGGWANWAGYHGFLDYIEVEPDTTYTFSNAENLEFKYGLQYYDSDKNWISGTNGAKTFTTPSNCRYIRGAVLSNTAPTQCQLELGSTATSYEPYVGGQASPNPDYPQPIRTVTGTQTVDIVGKNLFDIATASDVWIHPSGIAQPNEVWKNSDFIKVEPNTTYTLSGSTIEGGFKQFQYHEYSSNNESSYINQYGQINLVNSITFTTHTGCNFIRVGYRKDAFKDIQLEAGSTATTYAPYSKQTLPLGLGSIELCKLGTYQDYIYKDGDDWKVHKAISTITVDGSEAWTYNGDNKFNAANISGMAMPINADALCYCATHIGVLSAQNGAEFAPLVADKHYATDVHKTLKTVRIKDIRFTEAQALKTWLSQNNTTIYYVVATATDTTISDQTLIAQLEALVNGGSEEGTTYIKVSAPDSNLPGLLYVEAPKYD